MSPLFKDLLPSIWVIGIGDGLYKCGKHWTNRSISETFSSSIILRHRRRANDGQFYIVYENYVCPRVRFSFTYSRDQWKKEIGIEDTQWQGGCPVLLGDSKDDIPNSNMNGALGFS